MLMEVPAVVVAAREGGREREREGEKERRKGGREGSEGVIMTVRLRRKDGEICGMFP